jgi:hypothetical protein
MDVTSGRHCSFVFERRLFAFWNEVPFDITAFAATRWIIILRRPAVTAVETDMSEHLSLMGW